jgi:hypothetical protein
MPHRLIGSAVGALVVAALAPSIAFAAAPAKVGVRVEGPDATLVSTILTTTTKAVVKDGVAAHTCTGTSAAGALQQATAGKWTASWFDGLGYSVDTIEGVKPATVNDYWTLWINDKASLTGVCGSELQPGDRVLEFVCTNAQPPDFACGNRPLGLIAPRGRVRAGKAVALKVVSYKDDGTTVPVPGATVRGATKPVKADSAGTAKVVLAAGESALRATLAGDVPSATLHCAFGTKDGSCGSSDRTAPVVIVQGIRAGETFTPTHAPRLLHGVARDPDGAAVTLRLTRTVGKACTSFDGKRAAFRRCAKKPAPRFAAGDRARWSYLLPSKLTTGAYVLDVQATDSAGNVRNTRLRFRVGAAG